MSRPTKAETRSGEWNKKYEDADGGAAKLKVAVSYLLSQLSRLEQIRPGDADPARLHSATQIFNLAASIAGRKSTKGDPKP